MDPQRQLRGQVAAPPGRPIPIPTATNTRTLDPLTGNFPVRRNYRGDWSELLVALAGPAASFAPAGMGAWLRLVNIGPNDVGQEFVLASVNIEALSSDSAGGGGFTAWGNVQGVGAAIIVTKNIPLRDVDGFQAYPIALASLYPPVAGTVVRTSNNSSLIADISLPAGAYVASPQKVALSKDYAPFVHRFTYGSDRLQAWFVLPGAAMAALAGNSIRGLVKVNLEIGMVASARPTGI